MKGLLGIKHTLNYGRPHIPTPVHTVVAAAMDPSAPSEPRGWGLPHQHAPRQNHHHHDASERGHRAPTHPSEVEWPLA